MKPGEKPSESSVELSDMIKKAILDCEITNTEYDAIMKIAQKDKHIDAQEGNLLKQLQELLASGVIKRVAG